MSRPSRKAEPAAQAASTPTVRNLGKITAPTLQRVFGNERLFARLDAARFYPVVWIHGPPGAGKTTLAASYAAGKGVKPLWCRLDEGESDPASVFLHLAEAAKLCAPDLALPLLQPEFRTALPLFTRRFFRTLFATDRVPLVVLDDYHEVATGAELHDCLPAGLEEVPQGCQVIIISRSAPPSQLARLRLNGKVEVIEPCTLRLHPNEIRALAHERGVDKPTLAEEQIVGATQGWAAGVILMLEASATEAVETSGNAPLPEVLFDYFAGEVLQRMEPWAPPVLSALALMPTMTATTAERLTGKAEAGALLENLHRRNYFTTSDGAHEPRYRFHPLFRGFLRSAPRNQGTQKDETLLKIRAAAVLDDDEQADAAVQLLVETRQTEMLADLVKRRASALVEEGRSDTLVGWLSNLPDAQIAADPWLSYWRGQARVSFAPRDAYRHFETALARFEETDDVPGQFMAWIGCGEAVRIDGFGDMKRFDGLIAKMRALLARHPDFPTPGIELSVAIAMATALSRRGSDRDEFFRWQDRARAIAKDIAAPALRLRFGFSFAVMDMMDGRFDAASQALDTLPDPFTLDHLPYAQWSGLVAHALAFAFRQKQGDAEAFANEAIRRLEQSGILTWTSMLAAFMGMRAWPEDDAATCKAWRIRTEAYCEKAGIEPGPIHFNVGTGYKIITGDLLGAKLEAENSVVAASQRGWIYHEAQSSLMQTLALLAGNELDEAGAALDRLDEYLACSMSDSLKATSKLVRADLNYARGDEGAGDEMLAAALRLGHRQGKRHPLMTRAALQRLCARALKLGIEPEVARDIIRMGRLPSPDPFAETWPWPIRITTFGGLAIEIDGTPLAFAGKTPRRLLTLVKAIAAYGGRAVPDVKIADAVWPDEEGDAAFNALTIAIHRLRKLLGDNDAIVVSNGTIGVNPARCWLDVWTLEHLLGQVGGPRDDASRERLIGLYKADFLAEDEDLPWAKAPRDKWRRRLREALARSDGATPSPASTALHRKLRAAETDT